MLCSDFFIFTRRRKFRTGLDGLSLLPKRVQETSAARMSPSGVTGHPVQREELAFAFALPVVAQPRLQSAVE